MDKQKQKIKKQLNDKGFDSLKEIKIDFRKDFGAYFYNDYWLLVLLILLEKYSSGKDIVDFSSFLKGNYWHENIVAGFDDIHDFWSVEEYVIERIVGTIFDDFNIAKIESYGLDVNMIEFFDREIIAHAMSTSERAINPIYQDELFYLRMLSYLFSIKKYIEGKEEQDKIFFIYKRDNSDDILSSAFLDVLGIYPESFFIKLVWNKKRIGKLDDLLLKLIKDFTQSLDFDKQIDKFHEYISSIKIVNNVLRIPLQTMENESFSIIKILKYLQLNGMVEIEKWDVKDGWKVILKFDPKDISSYFSNSFVKGTTYKDDTLVFNCKEFHFRSSQLNQKLLLKILFSRPKKKKWTYDEIKDKWPQEYMDRITNNTFYTAAKAICDYVKTDDFLIYDMSTIKIYSKYMV